MEACLDDLGMDLFEASHVVAFGEEIERWVVLKEFVWRIGGRKYAKSGGGGDKRWRRV